MQVLSVITSKLNEIEINIKESTKEGKSADMNIELFSRKVIQKINKVEAIITKIGDELSAANIDGKIFVIDVPIAVDITTKNRGEIVIQQ